MADFDYDVFLSHSAKDKAVVRPLAERLRKDGVKVWFDEWVLKPGDSIPVKIEEGLERSRSPEIQQRVRDMQEESAIELSNQSKERALVGEVISTVALADQIRR